MSTDISINRTMVLITFLTNSVVARRPYRTQTQRLTLKDTRYPLLALNYILGISHLYM